MADQYKEGSSLIAHELYHVWQSRAMGDSYLAHYGGYGLLGLAMGRPFSFDNATMHLNYLENVAFYFRWFGY